MRRSLSSFEAAQRHPNAAKIEQLRRIHHDRARARGRTLTVAELELLFQIGQGGALCMLAANPRTPDEFLVRMAALRETKSARQIRHLANLSLREWRTIQHRLDRGDTGRLGIEAGEKTVRAFEAWTPRA